MQIVTFSDQIPLPLFIAGWIRWTERFSNHALNPALSWDHQEMPSGAAHCTLEKGLGTHPGYIWSVDVVCRFLCRSPNQMQAGHTDFSQDNAKLLRAISCLQSSVSGRSVQGYALTHSAVQVWNSLSPSAQEEMLDRFDALLEARGEVLEEGDDSYQVLPDEDTPSLASLAASTNSNPSFSAARSPLSFVQALVQEIQLDPYVPKYRGRAVGIAVVGWDQRLHSYFFPTPRHSLSVNAAKLASMHSQQVRTLIEKAQQGNPWTSGEQTAALQWAHSVFAWGGVPQPGATWQQVRAVIEAAVTENPNPPPNTPMNSGWTKVAAFATQLVGCPIELTIWDSRVAASITSRLDRALIAAGIGNPHAVFPDVGPVPGRGGTRPRPFQLKWKSGYQSWPAQIAGSRIVREIVNVLNTSGVPFPQASVMDGLDASLRPSAGTRNWTTREVEMVLFMDGY